MCMIELIILKVISGLRIVIFDCFIYKFIFMYMCVIVYLSKDCIMDFNV